MNPPSDKVRVHTPLDGKLLRTARIADTSSFHCGSVSKYLCLSQCISVFQLSADFFPYILNIFTAYIQCRAGQILLGEVLLCIPSAPSFQLQEVYVVPPLLLKVISSSVIKFMDFFHAVT